MALLRRAGWCESLSARDVLARYGPLSGAAPPASPSPSSPAQDACVRAARALLRALPIPSAEFAFGRSRVFIRSPRTVSAAAAPAPAGPTRTQPRPLAGVGAGGAAGGARVAAGGQGAARVAGAPRQAARRGAARHRPRLARAAGECRAGRGPAPSPAPAPPR